MLVHLFVTENCSMSSPRPNPFQFNWDEFGNGLGWIWMGWDEFGSIGMNSDGLGWVKST